MVTFQFLPDILTNLAIKSGLCQTAPVPTPIYWNIHHSRRIVRKFLTLRFFVCFLSCNLGLTKLKYIIVKTKTKTWFELARNDLKFAESILKNKNRPHYAVHFCHQAIEKILKAIITEKTTKYPPRTHNLQILYQQTGIELPVDMQKFLYTLSPHYLATKYPEDITKLYKAYNQRYGIKTLNQTKELFKWLKQHLK